MNKIDYPRLVYTLLNLFPDTLKEEILSDTKFMKSNGINLVTQISFDGFNSSFSQSDLFQAIRSAFLSENSKISLHDRNNNEWIVSIAKDNSSVICIEKDEVQLKSDKYWPLIHDIKKRISRFSEEAKQNNLPNQEIEEWVSNLSCEQPEDDVISSLIADLELTPTFIKEKLKVEDSEGKHTIDTLVPDQLKYYERLIGRCNSSNNINDYCKNELSNFISERENKVVKSLDILLCSQQSISQTIGDYIVDQKQFLLFANEALKSRNPISVIGCIEIGATYFLSSCEEELSDLFSCLSSSEFTESLAFFAAMTTLIDGELSRLQIFKDKPPFYRRLASLTQASFVMQSTATEAIDAKDFEQWVNEQRGLIFYCQTFIDLRKEPRWLPSYSSPEQIKNELYGRVYNVCQKVKGSTFAKNTLHELKSKSLLSLNNFLPGPLEGNIEPPEIPGFLTKNLDKNVNKAASLEAFTALINSAPIWRIDNKYIDRVLVMLDDAQHQLTETKDKDSIYHVLNGLAVVSSLVRSKKLSESVKILSRIYRDYLNVNSEPENILAIGLISAAAYEDLDEWAEFVGQWITELVYLPLEEKAVLSLLSMIENLCIIEPYLYYTCGRSLEILNCLKKT